ncbi:PhnD/SsuA/transferrin family substrate-binding protein [Blastococcus sp. SYSU D00820]
MSALSRRGFLAGAGVAIAAAATGCARVSPATADDGPQGVLRIGAVPDQDPDTLHRVYGALAASMSEALRLQVSYTPVTDNGAAVAAFVDGALDLVWFTGLTGVQARVLAPGAQPVASRDVDADVHSVFVVNTSTGLAPSDDLRPLAGLRFTYGDEASTSGRLMPAAFLDEQGVDPEGFPGGPGFAGSHEGALDAVASGAYEAGVLNERIWLARQESGGIDPAVVQYSRTPGFSDHHWLLGPQVPARLGTRIAARLTEYFTGLSPDDAADAEVLQLLGAGGYLPLTPAAHDPIEQIARRLGLVS